jgi:hypothetical protein
VRDALPQLFEKLHLVAAAVTGGRPSNPTI